MKTALAILFLSIFSFQLLPVKEIGKLIASQSMAEEIHETGNFGNPIKEVKLKHSWLPNFLTPSKDNLHLLSHSKFALRAETLIIWFNNDVLLQPPNL